MTSEELQRFKEDGDWICAFDEANGRGYTSYWTHEGGDPLPPTNSRFPRPSNGYTGSLASVEIGDIVEIIASSDGEKDERSWIGAFRLTDGRFLMVRASCDYTGWDCQAGGDSEVADSIENLVRWSMDDEERERLGFAKINHVAE